MPDDDFEARIHRFEQDWQHRGPAEIADHLRDLTEMSPADRLPWLIELVCVDMEFRGRGRWGAEPASLEDYVGRFPGLAALDRLPLDLIAEEYRVRMRWGDRPSHSAFLSRFAGRDEEIWAELARIDEELGREDDEKRPGSPQVPPDAVPWEGHPDLPWRSHRDFLLKRLIGQGRMGKVYEAELRDSGGVVAVKFLRKGLLQHPRVVRRFIGEAETVSGLDHPHIVATRGLGRTPGGSYFIVMDRVRGPNLAELGGRRAISKDEAVRWVMEACDALAYAHERGIVHCDIKPANLLLDEDGRVRVADFGLARSLAGDAPGAAEVEGTASFMAPEQVSRWWGPIDGRTDVYGVGAVLFALLTGRPPIVGRRLADVLAEVVGATPIVSPAELRPGLPEGVVAACRRCLAKRPEDRFATIREVHAALARVGR